MGGDRLHFTQKEEGRSSSRDGSGNFEREETLMCSGSTQANAFTKAETCPQHTCTARVTACKIFYLVHSLRTCRHGCVF